MGIFKVLGSRLRPWLLLGGLGAALALRAGPLDEAFLKVPVGQPDRGYGICLFDAKGELWSRYEGWANEQTGVRFSEHTVFRVGAVSDLFTALLALRLADRGLVDPERPVAGYLPELFSGAAADSPLGRVGRLKLGVLMSHLSGTDATFFLGYRDYDPFLNLRTYLEDVNLKYPPETKVLRSGAMIDLLGLALARAAGQDFDALARTELFQPLGMDASSFRFRDTPLFANLRYKSGAPDSYATRIPGFRDVVAPSGSMQASLHDLVRAYAALLRNSSGPGPLSLKSLDAMFSTRNEAVARRQGVSTGYGWKLTLPELAYLGNLAWYSGKYLSHRNVVILLPGLGLGAACATNAWSIFDRETILPMAIEVIKAYARTSLQRPEPVPPAPERVPMPAPLRAQVGGLYGSPYGICRVQPEAYGIRVVADALDLVLVHAGQNAFLAEPGEPLERVVFTPPDALSLHLRNGMVIEALRSRPGPAQGPWLQRLGTYRLSRARSGAIYAFTLAAAEGLPVISGDDGIELPLEVRSADWATITADESSRLFGQDLRVADGQGLLLGGVRYDRM